jgi:hypothetical protein
MEFTPLLPELTPLTFLLIIGEELEIIFSHLVSVELIYNLEPLLIIIFAFSNHDVLSVVCLARTLLSCSLLLMSVRLAELQLIMILLVDES